jgi:hypothetical protein
MMIEMGHPSNQCGHSHQIHLQFTTERGGGKPGPQEAKASVFFFLPSFLLAPSLYMLWLRMRCDALLYSIKKKRKEEKRKKTPNPARKHGMEIESQ